MVRSIHLAIEGKHKWTHKYGPLTTDRRKQKSRPVTKGTESYKNCAGPKRIGYHCKLKQMMLRVVLENQDLNLVFKNVAVSSHTHQQEAIYCLKKSNVSIFTLCSLKIWKMCKTKFLCYKPWHFFTRFYNDQICHTSSVLPFFFLSIWK